MSFQQGLSGLNAASKSLETIGNNVANSNTVGFKASQTQFADVYANSLSGGGSTAVGIGTKVTGVVQQFTQGNISSSNNPLDIAINGDGFFRMDNNGTAFYSRNGQFQLDRTGYIVNNNGLRLTGYPVDGTGQITISNPRPLHLETDDLDPSPTTAVSKTLNLDSRSTVPATSDFDVADATSYTSATSITVYDSLGNAHVMQSYYVKSATTGEWDVYVANDGTEIAELEATPLAAAAVASPPATSVALTVLTAAWGPTVTRGNHAAEWTAASTAGSPQLLALAAEIARPGATAESIGAVAAGTVPPQRVGTLIFNSRGHLDVDAMTAAGDTQPFSVSLPIYPATGSDNPLVIDLSYDAESTTQFGSNFSVSSLEQDGYTSGRLSGFNIGPDGIILGRYSNGRSAELGQVALVHFANPNGLQPLGNNVWAASSSSGTPIDGVPGTSSLGVLQSSAVEDSNVDLTAELVNMITAQRVYQANAQTIKTQDQVMQTLVNLR